MVKCSSCGKDNPTEAAFCGFCGGTLKQAAPEVAPAPNKTVFGYNLDPALLQKKVQAQAPAPAPASTPAPAAAPKTAPAPPKVEVAPSVVVDGKAATMFDMKSTEASEGAFAGRYSLEPAFRTVMAGQFHHARDNQENMAVDIFMVKSEVFPSALDMERARRELRQLQKVETPLLVKIFDHGKTDDGRMYISQESVSGQTLEERVAKKPLSIGEVQEVIKSVVNALSEAQKLGIVHRDIAPHNILLLNDGSVKLQGFGVAPAVNEQVFGTPEFISPEQAMARPVDQRSNIYSLGALMYYLVTGQPPFTGATAEEILEKQQKEDPLPPRKHSSNGHISDALEQLILKAMSKSSARRHLTLRQFMREVEALNDASTTVESGAPAAMSLGQGSFETPVHGMTALTGGSRPPSSEMERLSGPMSPSIMAAMGPTMAPGAIETTATTKEEGASGVSSPNKVSSASASSAAGLAGGELSSDVALKTPEPLSPEQLQAIEAKAKAQAASSGKPAFRETMWFFKGEQESKAAAEGQEVASATPGEDATVQEMTAKYRDDGSLSDEEAKKLSLRTGKTQMMMMSGKVPKGGAPGEKLAAEDFVSEMNKGVRYAIWAGIFLLLMGIGALVVYLINQPK